MADRVARYHFGGWSKGALALAMLLGVAGFETPVPAQSPERAEIGEGIEDEDALPALLLLLREGQADPHLPFILSRLKRALADQDLLGVLTLIDPAHFSEQYALQQRSGRAPAEALGRFACEFFSICDISKTYGFNDIVSAKVLKISPEGGLTGGPVEVTLELRMWDGMSLISVIFYDPSTARLSGASG